MVFKKRGVLTLAILFLFFLSASFSVYAAYGSLEAFEDYFARNPGEKEVFIQKNCIEKIPYGVTEADREQFCQMYGGVISDPAPIPTTQVKKDTVVQPPVLEPTQKPTMTASPDISKIEIKEEAEEEGHSEEMVEKEKTTSRNIFQKILSFFRSFFSNFFKSESN